MDKISIVMPSYNSEKYIEEAINSVINQSYTNWELLIVDDGSTDSTGKIIDSYSLKDNRIKVFHTSNYGVSHARNIGLDNSTGEWINFLDSDDILPNNALENLINNSKNSELVIGNFEWSLTRKSKYDTINKIAYYKNLKDLEDSISFFAYGVLFSTVWGKLIKKSVIDLSFDENYQNGEDTLFFATLLTKIKGIKLIPDNVYFYRKDNVNSLTHQENIYHFEITGKIFQIYIDYFKNPKTTKMLKQSFLFTLVTTIENFFKDSTKTNDENKNKILFLLNNDFVKSIEFDNFPYNMDYQRKASILLIGDIDLIMNEFSKKSKCEK